MLKRSLSIILSLLIVFSLFASVPFSAKEVYSADDHDSSEDIGFIGKSDDSTGTVCSGHDYNPNELVATGGNGDVDKDGEINIIDVAYIEDYLNGGSRYSNFTSLDSFLLSADVNGDGVVTHMDRLILGSNIAEFDYRMLISKVNVRAFEDYDNSSGEFRYPVRDFDYSDGRYSWDKQFLSGTNDCEKLFLQVNIDYYGRALYYGTSAEFLGPLELEVHLTAPNGFSFSQNKIESEYTYKFGEERTNHSNTIITKTFPVPIYPVDYANYYGEEIISLGTKVVFYNGVLHDNRYTIGTVQPIRITAYETYDASENQYYYPVDEFENSLGSFSWEKKDIRSTNTNKDLLYNTNYDKLYLKVQLSSAIILPKDNKTHDVEVQMTAPEGFSFSANEMESKRKLTFYRVKYGNKESQEVDLYPVYSDYYRDGSTVDIRTKATAAGVEKNCSSTLGEVYKNKDERYIELRNSFEKSGTLKFHYWVDVDLNGFNNSSEEYNHKLAELSAALSAATYQYGTMESAFRNLGFSNIFLCNYNKSHDQITCNIDQVACAFATKKIIIKDKESGKDLIYSIIAVAIRGTLEYEWYSNFDLGTGTIHRGFYNSYSYVSDRFKEYYDYLKADFEIIMARNKLLITGHSRAGAVADLLATEMNSNPGVFTGLDRASRNVYAKPENIYTYTFAAPNSTFAPIAFRNIFNIVCETDLVPHAPGKYRKSGITLSVGVRGFERDKEAEAQMLNTFKTLFINQDKNVKYVTANSTYSWLYDVFSGLPCDLVNMPVRDVTAFLDELTDDNLLRFLSFSLKTSIFINRVKTLNPGPIPDVKAEIIKLSADLKKATQGKPNNYTMGDWITDTFIFTDEPGQYVTKAPGSIIYSNHSIESYISWLYVMETNYYDSYNGNISGARFLELHCPIDAEVYDENSDLLCRIVNNEVVYENGSICCVIGDKKYFTLGSGSYTVKISGCGDGVMSAELSECGGNETVSRFIDYSNVTVKKGKTLTLNIGAKPENGTASYKLTSDSGAEIKANKDVSESEIRYANVDVYSDYGGIVLNAGKYVIGQRVTLYAVELNSTFEGWYLNGKLVSSEKTHFFVCDKDVCLEARFRYNFNLRGDVDGDGEVTIIDATCIQRKLANIPTAKFIEAAADADRDGELTIIDATVIQRWLAQLPTNDNIGKPIN